MKVPFQELKSQYNSLKKELHKTIVEVLKSKMNEN